MHTYVLFGTFVENSEMVNSGFQPSSGLGLLRGSILGEPSLADVPQLCGVDVPWHSPSNHDHDGHCEEPAENDQHMSGLTEFASWCLVTLRPPRPNRPSDYAKHVLDGLRHRP